MTKVDTEDLLTVAQAAEEKNVTRQAINHLIRHGKLPIIEIAGKRFISRKTLTEFEPDKGGRPKGKWKGYYISVVSYDAPHRYRVEFGYGFQQALKDGVVQKVPDFPKVIVDMSKENPEFEWKIKPENSEISLAEFEAKAIDAVENFIESK